MALQGKAIIKNFYTSQFYKDPQEVKKYLHPDVELVWHGSTGHRIMDFDDICEISKEMAKSYEALRADIGRVIKEKNEVVIYFTYYVKTIENPDEELPLAHFMAIWEIKEDKMFRGIQISQLAEDSPEEMI